MKLLCDFPGEVPVLRSSWGMVGSHETLKLTSNNQTLTTENVFAFCQEKIGGINSNLILKEELARLRNEHCSRYTDKSRISRVPEVFTSSLQLGLTKLRQRN